MDVKGEVTHKEGILFFSSSDTHGHTFYFLTITRWLIRLCCTNCLVYKLIGLLTILYLSMNINIITAFSVALIKASDCN